MKRVASVPALAAALMVALAPASVFAWGGSGHRMIGVAAMKALPAELPGFLKTPQAIVDVGEFSREPDRIKRAGKAFDSDRDQGHFLDLDDNGAVLGGPKATALPPTRQDYEKALQAVGQNSWKAGYLPYSIIEDYQQLSQEFAYWKALKFAESNPAWAAHKPFFTADRIRREGQILIAVGYLSHFVGDGSQPLHVSVHFNGWGDYPNPNGYSASRTFHADFEGALVRQGVTQADVEKAMSPLNATAEPIDQRIGAYLAATGALVVPLYELDKAGGLKAGDPRGPAFATKQIAIGASELRDLIVMAWRGADKQSVGWRPIPLGDILSGKVDPYNAFYAID
ncbi:MAG: S1/P1 Nuclease [Proteobacteria bacterium]|nr:S1/P1 Nuclease [Pseudomonadota bacterium]